MENKSHALMAGLFTLGLLIAAILVAIWFNRDKGGRIPYEMATTLSVTGLNPQADVRYRGLDVGKVSTIEFDPTLPGRLLVKLDVNPDTPVTKSTFGTLAYQGVTGIAYVQLDDDGSNPVRLESSPEHIARIEMRPSLLDTLQLRGLAILNQTEQIVKRFNTLLAPENQQAIMTAVNHVNQAATEFAAIPHKLDPFLDKLPALTAQAETTLNTMTRMGKNADALAIKLQAENGAVNKFSSASDQVGLLADRIDQEALPMMRDARTTLRTLNRTLERLGDRPQSILFGSRKMVPGPGEEGFDGSGK